MSAENERVFRPLLILTFVLLALPGAGCGGGGGGNDQPDTTTDTGDEDVGVDTTPDTSDVAPDEDADTDEASDVPGDETIDALDGDDVPTDVPTDLVDDDGIVGPAATMLFITESAGGAAGLTSDHYTLHLFVAPARPTGNGTSTNFRLRLGPAGILSR